MTWLSSQLRPASEGLFMRQLPGQLLFLPPLPLLFLWLRNVSSEPERSLPKPKIKKFFENVTNTDTFSAKIKCPHNENLRPFM